MLGLGEKRMFVIGQSANLHDLSALLLIARYAGAGKHEICARFSHGVENRFILFSSKPSLAAHKRRAKHETENKSRARD